MSPRQVPPLPSLRVIKTRESFGFVRVGTRGSHVKLRHADGRTAIVPLGKKDIPTGTMASILRQAKIDADVFRQALG